METSSTPNRDPPYPEEAQLANKNRGPTPPPPSPPVDYLDILPGLVAEETAKHRLDESPSKSPAHKRARHLPGHEGNTTPTRKVSPSVTEHARGECDSSESDKTMDTLETASTHVDGASEDSASEDGASEDGASEDGASEELDPPTKTNTAPSTGNRRKEIIFTFPAWLDELTAKSPLPLDYLEPEFKRLVESGEVILCNKRKNAGSGEMQMESAEDGEDSASEVLDLQVDALKTATTHVDGASEDGASEDGASEELDPPTKTNMAPSTD